MKTTTALAFALLAATALSARAADMPVYIEPAAPIIVPVSFSWTGFYAGAAASYGIGRSDAETTIEEEGEGAEDIDIAVGDWWSGGGLLGAHVGYQYQFGSFVLGAELAGHFSGVSGDDTLTISTGGGTFEASLTTDLNWLVTARAKAGIAFDRAMIYAIGGIAFADVENGLSISVPGTTRSWSNNESDVGWTLGGGLEYAITDSIIAGIEYQHVFLGTNTVDVDIEDLSFPVNFNNDFDIVSAKVSFKF
jgi:outer membrane immunogenic protein